MHHGNNHLDPFPVARFDHETGTVHFPGPRLLRRGDVKYAVLNHPDVFDRPGEFLLRNGRLRYIPFDGRDPNDAEVRVAVGYTGFVNQEAAHVTVRGFRIEMHRRFAVLSGDRSRRPDRIGFQVIDNVIENGGQIALSRQDGARVSSNRVQRVFETRPLHVTRSENIVIENNTVRSTYSGITLFYTENSLLKGNDVRDILGVHGNAMTIYAESHNVRVIGNRLSGDRGLALRDSEDLLIAFNRIHGRRFALVQWAPLAEGLHFAIANNTFAGPVRLQTETAKRSDFVNNIVDRIAMNDPEAWRVRTHNLHASFGHNGVARENFRQGEVHLPLGRAVSRVPELEMLPRPEAIATLSRGFPIVVADLRVSHIGAVAPDGALPDLADVGLPPRRQADAP